MYIRHHPQDHYHHPGLQQPLNLLHLQSFHFHPKIDLAVILPLRMEEALEGRTSPSPSPPSSHKNIGVMDSTCDYMKKYTSWANSEHTRT